MQTVVATDFEPTTSVLAKKASSCRVLCHGATARDDPLTPQTTAFLAITTLYATAINLCALVFLSAQRISVTRLPSNSVVCWTAGKETQLLQKISDVNKQQQTGATLVLIRSPRQTSPPSPKHQCSATLTRPHVASPYVSA